ncbi:MAG: hypothetical protein PHG85_07305 [Candidatus Altiarchaeota archaeon]|nr:hypothetical protein [Candidatus Altiarchaeota archaeon]
MTQPKDRPAALESLSKFSFGATSAITTSLALIVGLDSASNPRMSIIGALLVLAVADNISDSLGIHVYRESQCKAASSDTGIHSISNFLTRLAVTLLFALIVLLLPLPYAIASSLILGLLLLSILSYLIALYQKTNPWISICHHIGVAIIVLIASHLLGKAIAGMFAA